MEWQMKTTQQHDAGLLLACIWVPIGLVTWEHNKHDNIDTLREAMGRQSGHTREGSVTGL